MLSRFQKGALFFIFCFLVILAAVLEAVIIYVVIESGIESGKAISLTVNSGVLAGSLFLFWRIAKANFLEKETLPMIRLHYWASERTQTAKAPKKGQIKFDTRRLLVTNTLKFAEETLHGWIPGTHLELCVFLDPKQPLLFSYFDSNHDTVARSMSKRESRPSFYIDEGYEVTKLLAQPTSHPRIISDTHSDNARYVFTTDHQKKQIRSTFLLCLDLDHPCALVVSSNKANSIDGDDIKLMNFLRFVGELVKYDLSDGDFLQNIRSKKPELFPRNP